MKIVLCFCLINSFFTKALYAEDIKESIKILRLKDQKVLYEKNSSIDLAPASVMKIITAATAIERFGVHHRFKTGFYRTGPIDKGTILGDLVVLGGGDPYFVSEDLWKVANDLKNLGIETIKGRLIIDLSLFTGKEWDASRQDGKKISFNAYDAPVSSFAVNFNTFVLNVAPSYAPGQKAFVRFDPYPIEGIPIINNAVTGGEKTSEQLEAQRFVQKNGKPAIKITGSVPFNHEPIKLYRSVHDPLEASGTLVRSFLYQAGIKILGQTERGKKPEQAVLLLEQESKTLAEIIKGLLFYSNNYMADVLLNNIGAYSLNVASTALSTEEKGVLELSSFLKRLSPNEDHFHIKNGSGLDETNSLSANHLVATLAYMSRDEKSFPEFLVGFPTSGYSGSLTKRFKEEDVAAFKGFVRAKTGTLTQPISVSSLAGYISSQEHGLCAFAIIQNGKEGKKQPSLGALKDKEELILSRLFTKKSY